MSTVELIINSATTFYNDLKADKNGRYRSWEHCYKLFHDARHIKTPDYDYLSLHLAFYLASWGMYRGSSFLLQKDYKVHIPVVKEILKEEYNCLFGLNCGDFESNDIKQRLQGLYKTIENIYDDIRKSVKEKQNVKNKLSSTLITKVLMGTLGCVPAYDRYFIDGVKDQRITTGNYNFESLSKLADFYKQNYKRLEAERSKLKVYDLPYPQMKLLDMGFWQIGFEKDPNNKNKAVH